MKKISHVFLIVLFALFVSSNLYAVDSFKLTLDLSQDNLHLLEFGITTEEPTDTFSVAPENKGTIEVFGVNAQTDNGKIPSKPVYVWWYIFNDSVITANLTITDFKGERAENTIPFVVNDQLAGTISNFIGDHIPSKGLYTGYYTINVGEINYRDYEIDNYTATITVEITSGI